MGRASQIRRAGLSRLQLGLLPRLIGKDEKGCAYDFCIEHDGVSMAGASPATTIHEDALCTSSCIVVAGLAPAMQQSHVQPTSRAVLFPHI